MTTIFITGATGLIGSYISKWYIDKGWKVSALKRQNSDLSLLGHYKDKIDWRTGDLLDKDSLKGILENTDYVVHAAGLVSFDPGQESLMTRINVEGTKNILDLCLESNISKFCLIGSTAGLGKPVKGKFIDENIDTEKSVKNTHYALTKYLAEREVWEVSAKGLPVIIINPSVVIGIGDWNQSSSRLIDYVWKEKKFYPGGNINMVDIRDLVFVTDKLLLSNIKNERFIVSAHSLPYKTFMEATAETMNKPFPKYRLSKIASEILWRIEKIKSRLTKTKPFITKESARSTNVKYVYRSEKVKEATGIDFKPFKETIQWVCDAYIKEKK